MISLNIMFNENRKKSQIMFICVYNHFTRKIRIFSKILPVFWRGGKKNNLNISKSCFSECAIFFTIKILRNVTVIWLLSFSVHSKNFPKRYAWLSVTFLDFICFDQVTGNIRFLPWKHSWFREFSWFKWENILL